MFGRSCPSFAHVMHYSYTAALAQANLFGPNGIGKPLQLCPFRASMYSLLQHDTVTPRMDVHVMYHVAKFRWEGTVVLCC
jgi:hypothetical protein